MFKISTEKNTNKGRKRGGMKRYAKTLKRHIKKKPGCQGNKQTAPSCMRCPKTRGMKMRKGEEVSAPRRKRGKGFVVGEKKTLLHQDIA